MKNTNKIALAIFAAFLISSVAIVPINTQALLTDDPPSMKTYAISDAIPDVIGLGEETLLKMGITEALASQAYGWEGLSVVVTDPDGQNETFSGFKTDSTGSTYTTYIPDKIGTYTLTTYFPEQTMPVNTTVMERGGITILEGTIMEASTATSYLVVTEEPSRHYPGHALPSEYWSRPVDPQLREWAFVTGNWVARPDNSLAPNNDDAPETAHVLWANELTTGGLAGGLFPGDIPAGSEAGDAYEGKFPGSVVLNGILYYQRTDTRREAAPAIMAVDMHTGEEWMFRNNTILSFGQVMYFNSYNYDGVFSYVWSVSGSTYRAYDPFTGNLQMQINNVPSGGFRTFGPSGEILIYQVDLRNGWMALWNSTDAGLQYAAIGTPDYGSWGNTAHRFDLNGSSTRCYSWNVTIPKGLTQSTSFFAPIWKVYNEDRIVSVFFNQTDVRVWALPLDGITPTLTSMPTTMQSINTIYDEWWDAPSEWLEGSNTLHYVGASNNVENGVIGVWSKEITTHYGFSVENGKYLWATESEDYLDAYGWGNAEHTWYYAYDHLYSVGVGGIVYAYDLTDGSTVWTYNMTDAYGEPITGQNWWGWITLIADGKIYVGTCEHSAENPLPRGAPQICLNATDGSEIWRINGMFRNTRWGGNGVIGDSIIATMDTYDQRVYGIGKGPTQTTVTSPTTSIADGSQLIIQGMVTDISPGLSDYAITARFPSGVPAVSDESMSDWMLHVWKQFESPANASGVPVTVNVIDANGNYRTIGTTTSDSTGHYSLAWTPDISGTYQVYVTFEGTAGYYGSSASTTFVADEPHATAPPEATPEPTAADLYFMPAIIGLIIVVIVGFAATILMLTRRP